MNDDNDRHLVLVFGVGRSGTSLVTGILGQLGFHIPQPEIKADETNPRGFGEPEWVVGFHTRLMRRVRVTVFDSRPRAWDITGRVAHEPEVHDELKGWLGGQLRAADAVVVKDPRIGWFLPLWMGCAAELGVPPASITMLRHPAEILASARNWYGTWQTDASRAASWLNVMLETERATRGTRRVFVRYEDLLEDWLRGIGRIGEALGLPQLSALDDAQIAAVAELVDPGLRRSRVGWDELDVPASVRDMAEAAWGRLQVLAGPDDGETAAAQRELDGMRASYAALYGEAEAIAQSSVTAVKPRKARAKTRPRSLRARVARRVPERYRGRLRSALRAWRGSG